jgi:hypothetical protein
MRLYKFNGYYYDVEKLWTITKLNKIITVKTQSLESQKNTKIWMIDNNRVSINDVLESQNKFNDVIYQAESANLKFPLLLHIDYSIIDGYHRLTKAIINNIDEIQIQLVSPIQLEEAIFKINSINPPKFLYKIESFDYGFSLLSYGLLCYLKSLNIKFKAHVRKNSKRIIKINISHCNIDDFNLNISITFIRSIPMKESNKKLKKYLEYDISDKNITYDTININILDYLRNDKKINFN